VALTFVAASGGNGGATSATTRATTFPAGATTGDLVLFLVVVGSNGTWQAESGWTLEGQAVNPSGTVHSAAVYSRVLQAGDTAPTFDISAAGKSAWVGICWRPGAGETPSVYVKATTLITAAATTATPNPATSTDANTVSMVFNSNRAQVTGATGITQTPPGGGAAYTEPTNGDQSTATGTTTATRQVGAHLTYRAVGTGSIAPGAHTFNVSVIDIAFHYLLRAVAGGTSKDLADSGSATDALTVAQAKTLTDAGAASDTRTAAAAAPLADAGAATDTRTVAAAAALSDSGAGSDLLRPAASVPLPDAAAAADLLSLPPTEKTLADSGIGSEWLCHDGGPDGAPDCILAVDNLTGPLTHLWDDPEAADADWLTAVDPTLPTDLRVSFPTPDDPPASGGPTVFQAWLRKAGSGPAPEVSVQLWEAGAFVKELTSVAVTSGGGQLVTATLTPTDLAVASGAQVELRLYVAGDGDYHDSYDHY
jgi:hypothetical protein